MVTQAGLMSNKAIITETEMRRNKPGGVATIYLSQDTGKFKGIWTLPRRQIIDSGVYSSIVCYEGHSSQFAQYKVSPHSQEDWEGSRQKAAPLQQLPHSLKHYQKMNEKDTAGCGDTYLAPHSVLWTSESTPSKLGHVLISQCSFSSTNSKVTREVRFILKFES